MSILRARVYDYEYSRQHSEVDEARRKQIGSADRSEKIRTYNFPQNRVTDHRIGLSVYRLEAVLAGDLGPVHRPAHLERRDRAIGIKRGRGRLAGGRHDGGRGPTMGCTSTTGCWFLLTAIGRRGPLGASLRLHAHAVAHALARSVAG